MKYLSYISTTLLGLMFLVSAFAKAWDGEAFADMLLQYGPAWFSVGAPVMIALESLLGTALLLRFKPGWSACAGDVFLIVVSAIFAYGVLAKGIQDCGCFGALSRMFTGKPWMTFARNAVFIGISVPAILDKPGAEKQKHTGAKLAAGMAVAAVACFLCGLSMRKSFELPKHLFADEDNSRAKTMEKLNEVYPFDTDSTYVVYLFSFSCAHCQNSFANVQQYQQLRLVDKVLGIAIDNAEAQERFYRIYQPSIEIITVPNEEMSRITGQLPVCILIREGEIKQVESGFVTSPGIFLE